MSVNFSQFDVILLWCIPRNGASLQVIVRTYCFINRDAAPAYKPLSDCISKSIKAGILKAIPDHTYRIVPDWYARIHEFDEVEPNEFESMFRFETDFITRDWPIVCDIEFSLDIREYKRAVQ